MKDICFTGKIRLAYPTSPEEEFAQLFFKNKKENELCVYSFSDNQYSQILTEEQTKVWAIEIIKQKAKRCLEQAAKAAKSAIEYSACLEEFNLSNLEDDRAS